MDECLIASQSSPEFLSALPATIGSEGLGSGAEPIEELNTHPFQLIGEWLRSDWREIEAAPLPARITMLLEQLKRREASGQVRRWPISMADATTCLGEGESFEAPAAPMSDHGSRRRVLAEA